MQRYNIDSESDDEETDTPMEPKSSLADTQWTLDDIEKVCSILRLGFTI